MGCGSSTATKLPPEEEAKSTTLLTSLGTDAHKKTHGAEKKLEDIYKAHQKSGLDEWAFAETLMTFLATHTSVFKDVRHLENLQRQCLHRTSMSVDPTFLVSSLKESPFFMVLDEPDLIHFASFFYTRIFRKGEVLFKQGDPGLDFYVIAAGSVNLFLEEDLDGRSEFLCSKRKGDMFGEAVLKGGGVRNATVRCSSESTLLIATSEKYKEYTSSPKTTPGAAAKVASIMETRIDSLVGNVDLFTGLQHAQLQVLGNLFRYKTVSVGEVLIQEGDIGNEMFIVSQGSLTVSTEVGEKTKDRRESIQLGEDIQAGSYFGEIALLMDLPRVATVQATTRALLLCLSKKDFNIFLQFQPEAKKILDSVVKKRITQQFKKFKVPFFQAIPESRYHELATVATIVEVKPGETVFHQGDIATAFYLVAHGQLSINACYDTQYDEFPPPVSVDVGSELPSIGPGGEIAMLVGIPRSATVSAITRCILLAFSKESFDNFFGDNDYLFADFALRLAGDSTPLRTLLLHPRGFTVFEKFLETEHSGENLKFWKACGKYEKLEADDRLAAARNIYESFFGEDSKTQVNLSAEIRCGLQKILDSSHVAADTFSLAREATLELMDRDSFSRFKESEPFKALLAEVDSYHSVALRDNMRLSTSTTEEIQQRTLNRISTHFQMKSSTSQTGGKSSTSQTSKQREGGDGADGVGSGKGKQQRSSDTAGTKNPLSPAMITEQEPPNGGALPPADLTNSLEPS